MAEIRYVLKNDKENSYATKHGNTEKLFVAQTWKSEKSAWDSTPGRFGRNKFRCVPVSIDIKEIE